MATILIIEDDEADQFTSEAMISLVRPDVNILIAADGREALEILSQEKTGPDLILLDINMPRMNGHEFLEAFCEDKFQKTPVVVLLTSSDQQRDKERVSQYNCVRDYLLKPMDEDKAHQLLAVMDK